MAEYVVAAIESLTGAQVRANRDQGSSQEDVWRRESYDRKSLDKVLQTRTECKDAALLLSLCGRHSTDISQLGR
jgi:hypothetical protein